MPITLTSALASIMSTIFRGQNYALFALFLPNHLTSIDRSHRNQNYETLHIENIVTYITYNWPLLNLHFLEVVMIKTHCRLKLSPKLNSECKKTHGRTYHMAITVTLDLTSILTSIFGGQKISISWLEII